MNSNKLGHHEIGYCAIQDKSKLRELIAVLKKSKEFAFDIESTGNDPIEDEMVGISISLAKGRAYYIPLVHREGKQLPLHYVVKILKPIFEDSGVRKIGHHIKFDERFLLKYGIDVKGEIFDTMIAGYLIDERYEQGLKELVKRYLGFDMPTFIETLGKCPSFDYLDIKAATDYACRDADYILRLKELFEPRLKRKRFGTVFDLEMRVSNVVRDMEQVGICLNTNYLRILEKEMERDLEKLTATIYDLAGESFNINSTKQLSTILFKKLGLKPLKITKTQQSTDKKTLELLQHSHPIINHLIEHRLLSKLLSTYVRVLPEQISKVTNRVHTNFRQLVRTGRLSSSNPNLQNLPKGDNRIRQAFIASPGKILLLADYSQIEVRILAHISKDTRLINAFKSGQDMHQQTAPEIFKIPLDEVSKKQREIAKTVNFGLIYGMSEETFASTIKVSKNEARGYMQRYFDQYPGVKVYINSIIEWARKRGYVRTILGRIRHIDYINSYLRSRRLAAERRAINAPIQGSAADIIKMTMVKVVEAINGYDARLLLQVHDELIFEVKEGELEKVAKVIKSSMEGAYRLSVPLIVELKIGQSWGEVKEYVR